MHTCIITGNIVLKFKMKKPLNISIQINQKNQFNRKLKSFSQSQINKSDEMLENLILKIKNNSELIKILENTSKSKYELQENIIFEAEKLLIKKGFHPLSWKYQVNCICCGFVYLKYKPKSKIIDNCTLCSTYIGEFYRRLNSEINFKVDGYTNIINYDFNKLIKLIE